MLLGQHRRRHQHRDLLAVFDRLERRPHGQLGFAVTDIAAQQPIHRPALLHVLLDVFRRGDLVLRRLIRKLGLEFLLPFRVRRIRRPQLRLAGGLHVDQLRRHVHDCFGDFLLLLLPRPAAEPRERRVPAEPADVFLDQVDPRRGHMQRRVVGKAEREIFFALAVLGDLLHAGEFRDAVGDVDDVIADFQIEERIDRAGRDDFLDAATLFVAVEEFVMTEKRGGRFEFGGSDQGGCRDASALPNPERRTLSLLIPHESPMQISDRDFDLLPQARAVHVEQLAKPLRLAGVVAEDRD